MQPGVANCVLDSNGSGTATIKHDKVGIVWTISQIAIRVDVGGLFYAVATINGLPAMSPKYMVSGSAADGEPPLALGHSDSMDITISNGPSGGNVTVAYYYVESNG